MFHPQGVSLVIHNFAWFNFGLWLVLEPLLGGIAAYNITHLIRVLLCGLAIFWLIHDRTRATGPAGHARDVDGGAVAVPGFESFDLFREG